jgi:hypothetical protein
VRTTDLEEAVAELHARHAHDEEIGIVAPSQGDHELMMI